MAGEDWLLEGKRESGDGGTEGEGSASYTLASAAPSNVYVASVRAWRR